MFRSIVRLPLLPAKAGLVDQLATSIVARDVLQPRSDPCRAPITSVRARDSRSEGADQVPQCLGRKSTHSAHAASWRPSTKSATDTGYGATRGAWRTLISCRLIPSAREDQTHPPLLPYRRLRRTENTWQRPSSHREGCGSSSSGRITCGSRRQLDPSRRGEGAAAVADACAGDGFRWYEGLSTHQSPAARGGLRTVATAAKCHRAPVEVAGQPTGLRAGRRASSASPLPPHCGFQGVRGGAEARDGHAAAHIDQGALRQQVQLGGCRPSSAPPHDPQPAPEVVSAWLSWPGEHSTPLASAGPATCPGLRRDVLAGATTSGPAGAVPVRVRSPHLPGFVGGEEGDPRTASAASGDLRFAPLARRIRPWNPVVPVMEPYQNAARMSSPPEGDRPTVFGTVSRLGWPPERRGYVLAWLLSPRTEHWRDASAGKKPSI